MKDIVTYLGLRDDKVSAHSLRYGGATMLAASSLPQYIISVDGLRTVKHYQNFMPNWDQKQWEEYLLSLAMDSISH